MSFNLPAFVRDLARSAGIPEVHLSAVEHRAEMARKARNSVGKNTPLRGGSGLVIVSSLDGVDREIDAADRALGRRVVQQAAMDHARGVLERRVS